MAFAVDTKVPVERTQADIRSLLAKANADSFAFMEDRQRAIIAFELAARRIRFTLPVPAIPDRETTKEKNAREKETRSRWRCLLLVIRAKLESVESKIETFEEAFLAHIQMPSGRTVMEEIREPLALNYKGGNVPLLMGPKQ